MIKRNYDEKVMRAAKAVWKTMHDEAQKRGMALAREKEYGDGRIIISTIGAFIKALNKERRWGLDEHEIDMVRRFLKASGNVVSLGKIEQYRYRIFIREEWSAALLVPKAVPEKHTNKTTKPSDKDLGKDREPGPVEYKCSRCTASYPTQAALNAHMAKHKTPADHGARPLSDEGDYIISESQAAIMKVTAELGGAASHDHGRVKRVYEGKDDRIHMDSFAGAVNGLVARGWLKREGNAKRTYKVSLTKKGREVMEELDHYRSAAAVVGEYIQQRGEVIEPERGELIRGIASDLGITDHRVSNALLTLAKEGKIEPERSKGGLWYGAEWKGAPLALPEESVPEFVDELPPIKRPRKSEKPAMALKYADIPDADLVAELQARLEVVAQNEIEQLEQRLELIESLVNEATEGKMSPLKALAEIQEAVSL